MKPTVSVIVPVYNRAHLVGRTLDSISSQTDLPDLLIVVDNNSTDASLEIVERWFRNYKGPMRCLLLRESAPGAPAARDRGLAAADTDLVYFFDSDDTMRPDLISVVREEFESHPDMQVLYWDCVLHPLSGRPRKLKNTPYGNLDFQIFHSFLATQRFAVRRKLLIQAGGWDQSLRIWNDWELGIRILLMRPTIGYVEKTLVDIYAQEESITGLSFHSRKDGAELAIGRAEKVVERSHHPEKNRLLRLLNLRRAILAGYYVREGHRTDGMRLAGEAVSKTNAFTGSKRRLKFLCRIATLHTVVLRRGSSYWSRFV